MRLFFFLILLSCIFVEQSLTTNDTNYIRCTSSRCSQIVASFSQPTTFTPQCPDYKDDADNYEDALTCTIKYRINYDSQQVYIDFEAKKDIDDSEEQKSSEVLHQTLWYRFKEGIDTPNELQRTYSCNTKDDCARDFYLKNINDLVTNGLSQLEAIKVKLYNDSLLIGEQARRRCVDSNKHKNTPAVLCREGFCYLRLVSSESGEEQTTKSQSCTHNLKPFLYIESTHYLPKSNKDKVTMEYICNKNVCNRDDLISKIETLTKEYTNWDPVITESKIIEEKARSSATEQTIISYTLVSFITFLQLFI